MRRSWMQQCRLAMQKAKLRRLFLVLAAVLLLVQTGFPAHQDSHPIGSPDNQCQYCVLAGHALGVPSVALPPPAAPAPVAWTLAAMLQVHVPAHPRTRFSRAPPVSSVA